MRISMDLSMKGIAMDRTIITKRVDEIADLIRAEVKRQKSVWQTFPHWYLERQGRPGCNDNCSIIYQRQLYPIDGQWPPRVLVDCSTGNLVDDQVRPASSRSIVSAYLNGMDLAASAVVAEWMEYAGKDSREETDSWRQRDDAAREEMRTKFNVLPVCTEPPTPIKWGYVH